MIPNLALLQYILFVGLKLNCCAKRGQREVCIHGPWVCFSNYGWAEPSVPSFLTTTFFFEDFAKGNNVTIYGNITAWVIFDGDSGWPTCVFSGTPKWVWPKMVLHGLQYPQIRGFDSKVVPIRTQWTNSCTRIQTHRLWCHDTPLGWHWKHFDIYP